MPSLAESIPTNLPTAEKPIIRLEDLHISFGRNEVLRGLSLNIQRGKTTVILGPSGCGKSVTLKHIIGLLRPDKGAVWFEDEPIDRLSESQMVRIRRQIGFLFQQGALFDSMTVQENVEFPLREHTVMPAAERLQRVREVLRMVGLTETRQMMPAELSGGQRKRIALARAIVLRPKVVLYDEPTTGLDPIRADVINELIVKLKRELAITGIVVTHDLTSAFKVGDHLVMLHGGRVVMEGSPEEFRQSENPRVQRFLLGEATPEELGEILREAEESDDARATMTTNSAHTPAPRQ